MLSISIQKLHIGILCHTSIYHYSIACTMHTFINLNLRLYHTVYHNFDVNRQTPILSNSLNYKICINNNKLVFAQHHTRTNKNTILHYFSMFATQTAQFFFAIKYKKKPNKLPCQCNFCLHIYFFFL